MIADSLVDVTAQIEAEFDRLKVARPALLSRIGRAENILVTHLSCPKADIIKPRIRGGELVGYLVKGSGGAVYRVEPGTFSCSCPDYHRSNHKGCKHGIACYALGRAFRPAPPRGGSGHRRCDTDYAPKITRHDVAGGLLRDESVDDFEHIGEVASRVLPEATGEATASGKTDSYEERTCSRCLDGLTYDGSSASGEWVACERCSGTGRAVVFVYPKAGSAGRLLSECGERFPHRELIEVTEDPESLTWFVGDKSSASGHVPAPTASSSPL